MKAEEYLQSIREARARIHELEKLKEEINLNIISIKAITLGEKVQTSARSDGLEQQAIKAIEKMESINRAIIEEREHYIVKKDAAIKRIMRLNDGQCRRFLIDYYIDGKNEIEIARAYRFTNANSIYVLRKRALNYFSETDRLFET